MRPMQNNPMAVLLDQLLQRNPQIQMNPLGKEPGALSF